MLATITLVNISASTQATNFITPMFGHVFKKTDIASGTFPKFELTDGTNIPYAYWGKSTWNDGSWRFAGFLLGPVPSSIAGSGTLTVNIKNGGSAPASGSRALTDISARDLKVILTGVTNLTGDWTSSVNTGITDNDDLIEITQGGKHRIWRIGQENRDTTPANHGQLHCWHYVAALEDSTGALAGLLYCPRQQNGWADVSSPAADRIVATAVVKDGTTTLLTMSGTDSGETHGANITMQHYSRWFGVDTDAKWLYVQGGGSIAARATVQVKIDKTYWRSTKMLPPYDLTLSPTTDSSIDHYPYAQGSFLRNMGTTGERNEIGLLGSQQARHFLTQNLTQERVVRVNGMISAGWCTNLRRNSTKHIVALAYQGTNAATAYTGLGTTQPTWQYLKSSTTGFVAPLNSSTSLWQSEYTPDHRPSACYYAYLMTGEPQFLDLQIEHAAEVLASSQPGLNGFTASPVTGGASCFTGAGQRDYTVGATDYYGCSAVRGGDLARLASWLTRDIMQTWAVLPDIAADGSAVKNYFSDVVDTSLNMINAYDASRPTAWQTGGLYYFRPDSQPSEPTWAVGYLSNVAAFAALVTERSNAATFRDQRGKWWAGIKSRMDISAAASFNTMSRDREASGSGSRNEDLDVILFDLANGSMSWIAATGVFSIGAGGNGNFNFTPHTDDRFAFDPYFSANRPVAADHWRTIYYARDVSGQTFKLAKTSGGTAITPDSDSSVTRCYAAVSDFSPRTSFQNNTTPTGYLWLNRGAMRYLEASGYSAINAARVAIDAKAVTAGTDPTSDPKVAFAASY